MGQSKNFNSLLYNADEVCILQPHFMFEHEHKVIWQNILCVIKQFSYTL